MSIVVNILENFLGEPISHYEAKSQVGFDCPMCAIDKGKYDGDGKGNLAVNYDRGVYKCWACYDRNNMHGPITKLIKKYGNKQHLRDYLLVAPHYEYKNKDGEEIPDVVKLPIGFKRFSESSIYDYKYKEAYAYIKSRGVTDEMIKKYEIGYTTEGKKKNRIIIPSYDINGTLNYFIARSFDKWNRFKYLNPDAKKELIIFNEKKINWDSTIYIVEGVFDHIVTPNSIPLLGKLMFDKLFYELQTKAKGEIVIVFDGGEVEREDAKAIYKKLNTMALYGKIKVVNIIDDLDLSDINQKYGKETIFKLLKTAHKLKESRL